MATVIWTAASAGNWSTAGNWSSGTVPQTGDVVQIGTGSGATQSNITIDSVPNSYLAVDFTGYTGTCTHNAVTVTVSGTSGVFLKLVSTMVYTLVNISTSAWSFNNSSGTATITCGTWTLGNLTAANTGTVQFLDTFKGRNITSNNGSTIDTNGQTCTMNQWTFPSGASTRTITNSTLNMSGTGGTTWNMGGGSSVINSSGSTINMTGAGTTFIGGGKTYNNVVFTGGGNPVFITGANTYTNLTVTGTAAISGANFASTQTITGTLTLTGNSFPNYMNVTSNVSGASVTLSAGTIAITNCHLRDITAAGAASPFSIKSLGNEDLGNNSLCIFGSYVINNYQSVSAPDNGNAVMSVTEKVR